MNGFLRTVGLRDQQWLAEPSKALWASTALSVWRYSGFWMVFSLAGLQLISPSLYEAVRVDGASGWMPDVNDRRRPPRPKPVSAGQLG